MNPLTTDAVFAAIKGDSDDRGYTRTTLDNLAMKTGLSRSTIQRALTQLVTDGRIRRRVKEGRTGGILIRLETWSETRSETRSKPGQSDLVHHAFGQGSGPEGALRPPDTADETRSETRSAGRLGYRPAAPHEIPESGAELLYTGNESSGGWTYLSKTMWRDPNGFTVSVKSMTPELRMRLRVDEDRP